MAHPRAAAGRIVTSPKITLYLTDAQQVILERLTAEDAAEAHLDPRRQKSATVWRLLLAEDKRREKKRKRT
jgi:hypothetical protein